MSCLNAADEMALSIITINVNGLRDAAKRAGVVQWLQALPSPIDIVCLQEVHCTSVEECTRWFSSSGLSCVVSSGSVHSCGCVVLYRPRLSLVGSWSDADGRFLQCEFSFQAKLFRVACIYAPNRNPARDTFFRMWRGVLIPQSLPCSAVILTLFLIAFWTGLARTLSILLVRAQLRFHVSFRPVVFLTSGATWSRWNGLVSCRIDLFGVPFSWVSAVSACDILPFPFSDHCAVHLSVSVPEAIVPGPGLWKLNLAVLDEPEYVTLISAFWAFWRSRAFAFSSQDDWWDEGKREIKRLSIDYCKKRASARRTERDLLVRLAEFLKQRVDSGAMFCFGPYQSTLSSLAKFDLEAARGAQVRSRARWVEEGESSSAYFFRLVKKQGG